MLEKQFDAKRTSTEARKVWAEEYNKPQASNDNKYCIMLPPPNVTGTLHMGHGFQHTLMDALIRYHRMCGDQTLWQPGTDHAGISTQMVVENQLKKENINRQTLGREGFEKRVWQWKEQSGETIIGQMKKLGASCDWSRLRFTMDQGLSDAVVTAFVKLYEDGLIYRGTRLVNWDPILQTALSDLEVLSEEEQGSLWYIRYPLTNNLNQAIIIATTRPETLFGDVAVAVHPDDERYQSLIGQTLQHPLTGKTIPVIADDYVRQDFGSGAVKITPAHDVNDFEIGKRHDLEAVNIFSVDAKLNQNVPAPYQGLMREEARKQVIAELTAQNLIEKIVPHSLQVPRSERTGTVVEPYLSEQWYLKMESLAADALQVVEEGKIQFVPDNWRNTYRHWLTNIQDWCISRQLWWGHRIPAWYDEQGNVYVAHNQEEAQAKAGVHKIVRQETDVLDTWFSSALWPFSTLGWPAQTPELKDFYPTNVLITGFDIIFFWVARMIMFGLYFTKQIPFKQVLITGLIRDQDGQKMSKSKGNVIDPIDLIDGISLAALLEKRTSGLMLDSQKKAIEAQTRKQFPQGIAAFGEDALRFTYCALATQGRDIRFDLGRSEGYRNFCNKIWNATRFIEMQLEKFNITQLPAGMPDIAECADDERWLIFYLNELIGTCHKHFAEYRFDLLAEALYSFIWYEFCDKYIEKAKRNLNNDQVNKQIILRALMNALDTLLRLLHPLMPFITEDIWQNSIKPVLDLPKHILAKPLMLQSYPEVSIKLEENKKLPELIDDQDLLIEFINSARGFKKVKPKDILQQVKIWIREPGREDFKRKIENLMHLQQNKNCMDLIGDIAKVECISFEDFIEEPVAPGTLYYKIWFPYEEILSEEEYQAQVEKAKKEEGVLSAEKIKLAETMANPSYVIKVPEKVKRKNSDRLTYLENRLNELKEIIQSAKIEKEKF